MSHEKASFESDENHDADFEKEKTLLKHRVSDCQSIHLLQILSYANEVERRENTYNERRARRGQKGSNEQTFSNLLSREGMPQGTAHVLGWLCNGESPKASKIPLAEVVDILKGELLIRYEEKLEKLDAESTPEELETLRLEEVSETESAKEEKTN